MAHRHRIRVRYGEVDMQRVVFNAHYLAYCDDAVSAWQLAVGVVPGDGGWDCVVKKAVIEWHASATFGDDLDIEVRARRWGRTSFDLGFAGAVAGRSVFDATITYVSVRPGTAEPVATPERVRALLAS